MSDKGIGGTQLLDPENILRNILRLGYKDKVADLGCGSMAYFTMAAAKIVGEEGTVYALDILKDVLSSVEAKSKLEGLNNIKTIWSNLEVTGAAKIPTDMDYVFLVATIFQNKEYLKIFQEAARLLREDGKLLLIEWLPQNTAIGPALEKRVSPEQMKQIANQVNLTLEQEFSAGQYHYGMIFKK